jgi:glyoxylase-like metal-dependent hydrolase (beta-lactamase superfamily II)
MKWTPISDEIDFVFPIPVPTQTLPPHRDTNSFLVGHREIGMIDAGLWDEKGVDALVRSIGKDTGRRLSWLILTHWHPDHLTGTDRIKERTGCRVGVHVSEADKVAPVSVDFTFQHGDEIPFDDRKLEVIHTPGHSAGHCCFLLRPEGVLFTGDHILGLGTSIIVPPDGDMELYLASLSDLLCYPVRIICPGHGPLVWNGREKIEEYIEHRRARERAILEGVRSGIRRTEDLVTAIYTDIPESFHGMAYFSVEAHLVKLIKEGKIRKMHGDEGYEPV